MGEGFSMGLLRSTAQLVQRPGGGRTRRTRRVSRQPETISTPLDSALECFVAVARHHGIDLSVECIKHDFAVNPNDDIDSLIASIAQRNGFRAKKIKLSWKH